VLELTDADAVLHGPVERVGLLDRREVERVRHTQALARQAAVVVRVAGLGLPVVVPVDGEQHGHVGVVQGAQLVHQVDEQTAGQIAECHACGRTKK
jgi:hypothetical protein